MLVTEEDSNEITSETNRQILPVNIKKSRKKQNVTHDPLIAFPCKNNIIVYD